MIKKFLKKITCDHKWKIISYTKRKGKLLLLYKCEYCGKIRRETTDD